METQNNNDIKVLIVDDSEFSRKVISRILTEATYNVVGEASNANEAIDVLNANNEINVILIDIIMPDINGIELAKRIHKAYSDSFIIMISSLSQEHIIIESISAGAVDFIKKPFEKQTLIDSVDKVARQIRSA